MNLIQDIKTAVGCIKPELYFSDEPVSCIGKGQLFPLVIAKLARRNSVTILSEEFGRRKQYNLNLQIWTEWQTGCTAEDEATAAAKEDIVEFEGYLINLIALLTDPIYTTGNYNISGNIRISHAHKKQTEHNLIGISANFLLNEKCAVNICCTDLVVDTDKLLKIKKR